MDNVMNTNAANVNLQNKVIKMKRGRWFLLGMLAASTIDYLANHPEKIQAGFDWIKSLFCKKTSDNTETKVDVEQTIDTENRDK